MRPRIALTALLILLLAAPSAAEAWPGRSHWRFSGHHHSWLFKHHKPPRTLPTGAGPQVVLVDPDTRTVYVTNDGSSSVSVLDASTCNAQRRSGCGGAGVSVPVGNEPVGLALNDRTLYVANAADGTLSVIDAARCNARTSAGCRAPVATVDVGEVPVGIAVDPVTDTVYVGRPDHAALAVVDGTRCNRAVTTGCAAKAAASLPGGVFPFADPATRSTARAAGWSRARASTRRRTWGSRSMPPRARCTCRGS